MQVLFELTTEELTEEADKVGDYEGVVPMLVEAQEEGYLARILHRESDEAIKVWPIATLSICSWSPGINMLAGTVPACSVALY